MLDGLDHAIGAEHGGHGDLEACSGIENGFDDNFDLGLAAAKHVAVHRGAHRIAIRGLAFAPDLLHHFGGLVGRHAVNFLQLRQRREEILGHIT